MTAYVINAESIHENSVNYFSASFGFYRLGYYVEEYKLSELRTKEVNASSPVFGGMESLEIVLPDYRGLNYYPPELSDFVFREVSEMYVENVIDGDFFKPLPEDHKMFSPMVKSDNLKCKLMLGKMPDQQIVLSTKAIEFLSEFRTYVLDGEIMDVCFYKGDPLRFPDVARLADMAKRVAHYGRAFSLDVGVLSTGETALVEMNDFCCLGNYDLNARLYSLAISKRWEEVFNLYK